MDLRLLLGIVARRRTLRRQDRWSRAELERHQRTALATLRRHACEHSAFYRARHAGALDAPLSELPIVTKAELIASFDDAVCDRRLRWSEVEEYLRLGDARTLLHGSYHINATSGSTGRRGVFPFDRNEWTWILASYARAYEWGGVVPGIAKRSRMAVASTTGAWHQSAQVGASVASWFVPTLRLDATSPIESLVRELNAWRPETLVGYPSVLHLLAGEQIDGRLRIAPRAVFSAAEVLTAGMRRRMADAWGVEPFDIYGATEAAAIASECGEHRMHLFEDLVITESVDESGRPAPAGEPGEKTLVTVLFGRTLPLIRYEMSDRIVLSDETCPCGRVGRVVESIEGRSEEELLLPGSEGRTIRIHPNTFHDVLDHARVDGWQVVQSRDSIVVSVVDPTGSIALGPLAGQLERALEGRGVRGVRVSAERIDRLPRGTFGKAPLVRRELR
jgi:phenylacetate-coenzyme A ligase PaaK-like adenylate-forming protein